VKFTGDIYSIDVEGARAAGIEARLSISMSGTRGIEHEKIVHIRELHRIERD